MDINLPDISGEALKICRLGQARIPVIAISQCHATRRKA